jgi:probable phosphoglycerate mutase
MKIYLLRHGEIEQTAEKRLIGQTDVDLTANGKRQAVWWRSALERIALKEVYCSDLVRSRQSAQILAADVLPSVTIMAGLREIDLGAWDGLTAEEVKTTFPGEWEKRGADIAGYRPEEGESFLDLSNRVVPILDEIADDSEDAVAIVGHAGVNRVLLCHVLGLPLEHLFRLRQDYGALNIIEYSSTSRQVCLMNLAPK